MKVHIYLHPSNCFLSILSLPPIHSPSLILCLPHTSGISVFCPIPDTARILYTTATTTIMPLPVQESPSRITSNSKQSMPARKVIYGFNLTSSIRPATPLLSEPLPAPTRPNAPSPLSTRPSNRSNHATSAVSGSGSGSGTQDQVSPAKPKRWQAQEQLALTHPPPSLEDDIEDLLFYLNDHPIMAKDELVSTCIHRVTGIRENKITWLMIKLARNGVESLLGTIKLEMLEKAIWEAVKRAKRWERYE